LRHRGTMGRKGETLKNGPTWLEGKKARKRHSFPFKNIEGIAKGGRAENTLSGKACVTGQGPTCTRRLGKKRGKRAEGSLRGNFVEMTEDKVRFDS